MEQTLWVLNSILSFWLQAVVLQQALHQIPSPTHEVIVRNLATRLAMQLLGIGAAFMPDQVRQHVEPEAGYLNVLPHILMYNSHKNVTLAQPWSLLPI